MSPMHNPWLRTNTQPTPGVPVARATRPHTPEPNPGYDGGKILQNPVIPVYNADGSPMIVNGIQATGPAGYDVVLDFMVAYDPVSPETPTGIRTKQRTNSRGTYMDSFVHLWGRVAQPGRGQYVTINGRQYTAPACLGVVLRGDAQLLQLAAQLKRGQVVSFTGRLGVGNRNDGRPDVFFNATSLFNVAQGQITVPLTSNAIPQSVMPQQNTAPAVTEPAYIPVAAQSVPEEAPAPADPSVSPF